MSYLYRCLWGVIKKFVKYVKLLIFKGEFFNLLLKNENELDVRYNFCLVFMVEKR